MSIGRSALLTDVAMCVNHYRLFTPGLFVCIQARLQLEHATQLVPDLMVVVNAGHHKQCQPDYKRGIFIGAPNLIIDVIDRKIGMDLDVRKALFEKNAVLEYVQIRDENPIGIGWNVLAHGKYERLQPDEDGIFRSRALPGLWMGSKALENRDWWSVMSQIERGVSRKGHHDFMASIWYKSEET